MQRNARGTGRVGRQKRLQERPKEERTRISVYSGLTLTSQEVTAILPEAIARPPVKQFDLLADIREGFHVVVIVDGVFHHSPAVSPSEIMDALRRGMLVYGCSSMGALRAAELYPYGMRGVGEIFEWSRQDPGFRDDFPAQTFSSEDGIIVPRSVPYVDFVFGVRRLLEQRRLSSAEARFLERTFREMYYPDRSLPALVAALSKTRPKLIPAARLALSMPSQKRADAIATLKRVKEDLKKLARLNEMLAS